MSQIIGNKKIEAFSCYQENIPEKIIKYLPSNTVFYVKGRAALTNNQVSLLDPSKVEIGRMSIPINMILSFDVNKIDKVYAADQADVENELSSYSGKKAKIVAYINEHLVGIQGFFAKSAFFSDNALHFDGNLNEAEATVR